MIKSILLLSLLLAGCAAPRPQQSLRFDAETYPMRVSVTTKEAIRNYADSCMVTATIENYGKKDYSGGFARLMLITVDQDSITKHISFNKGLAGGGDPHVETWIGWSTECPLLERGKIDMHPR